MEDPLAERDVRALVRLVASCATVTGGVMAQKRHLVQGLADLLDAETWMWNVARITDDGRVVAVSILHNLSERQLALLAEENYRVPENPYTASVVANKHLLPYSRRLEDLVDVDAVRDALYTSRPEIGMAHSLFCNHAVDGAPDMTSVVGLHREHGREPFTQRDLRIAHIVCSEVDWLHDAGVPEEDGGRSAALAPRLQTVLTLLVDGLSAKQIAFHLGLTVNTVRGYVKDIYRHFTVGSRQELMRRFMVGDGRHRG